MSRGHQSASQLELPGFPAEQNQIEEPVEADLESRSDGTQLSGKTADFAAGPACPLRPMDAVIAESNEDTFQTKVPNGHFFT